MPKNKEAEKMNGMIAVVCLGGKQYLVKEGDEFLVDYLRDKELKIKPYLVIDKEEISLGKPEVEDYLCEIRVLDSKIKGEKKIVFKYRPKTGYHRKRGVRALYSHIKINKIKKIK